VRIKSRWSCQDHRDLMRTWADQYDLITTGGSDCHDSINRPLGVAGVSPEELAILLARLGEPVPTA